MKPFQVQKCRITFYPSEDGPSYLYKKRETMSFVTAWIFYFKFILILRDIILALHQHQIHSKQLSACVYIQNL